MQGNDIKISRNSAVVIQFPHVEILRGESAMQIDCPECGHKAIIFSRKFFTPKFSKLYCGCKDPECAHSFAVDLSFSHSLSPSKLEKQNLAIDFIRSLPEKERQQLLTFA